MKVEIEYNKPQTTFNMINLILLRDRLKQLADPEAPKPDIGFNMACYTPRYGQAWGEDKSPHECRTVCCIGGHAAILGNYKPTHMPISIFAQKWLGLKCEEAAFLFGGSFSKKVIWDVKLEEAIECLDYMITHGKMPNSNYWKMS